MLVVMAIVMVSTEHAMVSVLVMMIVIVMKSQRVLFERDESVADLPAI